MQVHSGIIIAMHACNNDNITCVMLYSQRSPSDIKYIICPFYLRHSFICVSIFQNIIHVHNDEHCYRLPILKRRLCSVLIQLEITLIDSNIKGKWNCFGKK